MAAFKSPVLGTSSSTSSSSSLVSSHIHKSSQFHHKLGGSRQCGGGGGGQHPAAAAATSSSSSSSSSSNTSLQQRQCLRISGVCSALPHTAGMLLGSSHGPKERSAVGAAAAALGGNAGGVSTTNHHHRHLLFPSQQESAIQQQQMSTAPSSMGNAPRRRRKQKSMQDISTLRAAVDTTTTTPTFTLADTSTELPSTSSSTAVQNNSDYDSVPVECNGIPGRFRVRDSSVRCLCIDCRGAMRYTASRWEAHCGRGNSRKWRMTVRVTETTPPKPIGVWLSDNKLDDVCRSAGPGRPKGYPAWNRGEPMSSSHRDAIASKLREKWKDTEFRQSVIQALQGNPAWNKDVPMSRSHREAVSAAHKKRANALRVFKQVQATLVSKSLDAYDDGELSDEVATSAAVAIAGSLPDPVHANVLEESTSDLSSKQFAYTIIEKSQPCLPYQPSDKAVETTQKALQKGKWNKKDRAVVTREVRSVLRAYRDMHEELKPWTTQFETRYRRKPTMTDVEMAGMPWLVEKFRRYVTLRSQLFEHGARGELSSEQSMGKLNANKSARAAERPKDNADSAVKNMFNDVDGGPGTHAVLRALEYQEVKGSMERCEDGDLCQDVFKSMSSNPVSYSSASSPSNDSASRRVHNAMQRAAEYKRKVNHNAST